ncbi:MAG: MFS transporter [Acidobacteria bacterium]|nr:MFS transporter [Acidobacteriota bacterium]
MRSRWETVLGVLFLVNVLNFYDRLVLGAVLEPVRREFALSDTQLGAMVTLFTLVFAAAGLPAGRLSDTRGRRGLLALGIAAWAALTGLSALAVNYAMLLATRLGVGIGEAVCTPAATSWIGDTAPPGRRTRAMAWFMMAVPVGGLLSYAIGGGVAQALGWRAAMAVAAAPALLLAPAVLWLKEPARTAQSAAAPAAWQPGKGFWWIAASGAAVNFALYAFSTFLPAMLTRYHGMTVASAGVWVGIGTGVSGIAGALAAGAAGDRTRSRLGLTAWVMLAAALPMFLALRVSPGGAGMAVTLAMIAYGMMQMYYGLVYAALHDLVPAGAHGRAMSLYLLVTYLGGASWGPVATGRLSDWLARASGLGGEAARAAGLHGALYVVPALAVVLAGILWMAARSGEPRWSKIRG